MTCASPAFPDNLRKPPVVRRGDRVGLIAPASPLDPGEIELGIAHMRALGLEPILGRFAHARYGYLAGTDRERADDFNRMIADDEIRAIVALRGGYGTMRILDHLDYDALRARPKVVMGFSDMTAVLNAITRRSGIITFHGPVAARDSSFGDATRSAIKRTWMSTRPVGTLRAAGAQRLTGGTARGHIAGGNLTLVASLLGTPYAIASAGSLLLLEETQEEPYRIDRMLTQLRLANVFHDAHGVVVGECTHCEAADNSLSLEQVMHDRIGSVGRPSFMGAPVGHIDKQWVLPIGLEATLDADAKTLTIAQSAVSAR